MNDKKYVVVDEIIKQPVNVDVSPATTLYWANEKAYKKWCSLTLKEKVNRHITVGEIHLREETGKWFVQKIKGNIFDSDEYEKIEDMYHFIMNNWGDWFNGEPGAQEPQNKFINWIDIYTECEKTISGRGVNKFLLKKYCLKEYEEAKKILDDEYISEYVKKCIFDYKANKQELNICVNRLSFVMCR